MIGDGDELGHLLETAGFNAQEPSAIVQASLTVNLAAWLAERRVEAEEYEFSEDETLGEWPGEVEDKGAVSLHLDISTDVVKPEIYLGLATIDEPWMLPAVTKYGTWNDCPEAEIHCAFHRKWQKEFGAQITGMSGDVIECTVANPPRDRKSAFELAWQQYWYCADIVEQGCESISNLAATLLDSPYWFFWWD